MRKTGLLGAPLLALALVGFIGSAQAQTADAAPAKPAAKTHHKAAKPKVASAADAATDDLNAKSLDDAKAGKSFAPPTPTPAPAPAKKSVHKHAAKKAAAAPAADAPK